MDFILSGPVPENCTTGATTQTQLRPAGYKEGVLIPHRPTPPIETSSLSNANRQYPIEDMSQNWNLHQQIFAVCLASNAANQQVGTEAHLQEYLYTRLVALLKQYTGDKWQIGWGPVVWKQDPNDTLDGIGNAWFVARNKALTFEDGQTYDTYVVSIAATSSINDWIYQNAGVNYVVDFDAWVKGGIDKPPQSQTGNDDIPFVAYGTASGVYNIVTTPVPPGPYGVGTGTLLPFLSSIPSKGTKIIFTGFSLGGGLSPTLALATRQSGMFNNFREQDVLAYPCAGPSPGNEPLSNSFATQFPFHDGPGYNCWNANIVNLLDVVPQAWCDQPTLSPQQNIDNIISIWGGTPLTGVMVIVYGMGLLADNSGVTYFPIRSRYFSPPVAPTPPTTMDQWYATAQQEHESAYMQFMGVQVGFKHITLDPRKIIFKPRPRPSRPRRVAGGCADE